MGGYNFRVQSNLTEQNDLRNYVSNLPVILKITRTRFDGDLTAKSYCLLNLS